MKVLICDDHELFRDGLSRVLFQLEPRASLIHASDGASALELAGRYADLELAIVDFTLPDTDGLSLLATLRERFPTVPVVMISGSEDPDLVRSALEAGASGFVPKSTKSAVLLGALRLVLEGEIYVPKLALGGSPAAPAKAAPRRRSDEVLTPRQREVAQLMARGLTNREICDVLKIAEGTVKAHVAAILEALDVSNRTEAVMALGELDLEDG